MCAVQESKVPGASSGGESGLSPGAEIRRSSSQTSTAGKCYPAAGQMFWQGTLRESDPTDGDVDDVVTHIAFGGQTSKSRFWISQGNRRADEERAFRKPDQFSSEASDCADRLNRMWRRGDPPTISFGSTARCTTELAPTIAPSPMTIPGPMYDPAPIQT